MWITAATVEDEGDTAPLGMAGDTMRIALVAMELRVTLLATSWGAGEERIMVATAMLMKHKLAVDAVIA